MTAQTAMIMISINLCSFVRSIRGSCISARLSPNERTRFVSILDSLGWHGEACRHAVDDTFLPLVYHHLWLSPVLFIETGKDVSVYVSRMHAYSIIF